MAYLFLKKHLFSNGRTDKRTHGHTDKRTHGQTNGRTDGRSDYIMPQILFGGIKILPQINFSSWYRRNFHSGHFVSQTAMGYYIS